MQRVRLALTRVVLPIVAFALAFAVTADARAQSAIPDDDLPSGYFVTIAARQCPAFTDIRANLARNNLQESLRDLGQDSPYVTGQQINPQLESQTQPACTPLIGWQFTLGTGIAGAKVIGSWGSLSVISGPLTALSTPGGTPVPLITTEASIPNRDNQGATVTGSLAGATTIELTNRQARLAEQSSRLWLQGGTTTDPALFTNPTFAGGFAFGALRCAIDNLNGDNVEWIKFPSIRHVYCYAYYVTPPPSSGTIIIRKRVSSPANATATFDFEGNVSYTANHTFSLVVAKGSVPSQTFYRAATQPGSAPWTFRELGTAGFVMTGIDCTTVKGSTVVTTSSTATVRIDNLIAGDTVDCTFTNELRPTAGTLLISKVSTGGVGKFGFTIAGGSTERTATATTTTPGDEVEARPGPIALDPGNYTITEDLPESDGGTWRQTLVNCNAKPLTRSRAATPITITADTGTVCRFTNSFIPDGRITITKVTRGGPGTTGFLIAPLDGPPRQYLQTATGKEDEVVFATGDSTKRLPLGTYGIQETSTVSTENAHWAMQSVVCNGELLPFEQGRVFVTLTEAHPEVECDFENTQVTTVPNPPTPTPTPTPTPPTPAPAPQPGARPDLTLTKRALERATRVGQIVEFEVAVRNSGTADAVNVAINDRIGRGGQIVGGRPSQGVCRYTNKRLGCQFGTLAPGARATVRVRVRATAVRVLVNLAVTGSGTLDRRLTNNVARARVIVLPAERVIGRCARATCRSMLPD